MKNQQFTGDSDSFSWRKVGLIWFAFSVLILIFASCRHFQSDSGGKDNDSKAADSGPGEEKTNTEELKSLHDFKKLCTDTKDVEERKVFDRLGEEGENCDQLSKRVFDLEVLDLSTSSKLVLNLTGSDQEITTVAPLRFLIKTKTMLLQGNKIADLSPLSSLPALKELSIRDNPVTELPVVESLEILDVSNTKITSINSATQMKNLKELYTLGLKLEKSDIDEVNGHVAVLDMSCKKLDACAKPVVSGEKVFDSKGFNQSGLHKNGTAFDDEGYDIHGYDKNGFDRKKVFKNGTPYDDKGFDYFGHNKKGFDRSGTHKNGSKFDDKGFDKDGYNSRGFLSDKTHKNGSKYDDAGYDFNGYNDRGFNSSGTHKNGTDRDSGGFDKDGFNSRGFSSSKVHRNGRNFDDAGYDFDGYDARGFNSSGRQRNGNQYGPSGADILGFRQDGYDLDKLDNQQANEFRERKVTEYMTDLQNWHYPLFDMYAFSEIDPDIAKLEESLGDMVGHGLVAVPSRPTIYNELLTLRKFVDSIRTHNLVINQLNHVVSKLRTSSQTLNFQNLWSGLGVNSDNWYTEFYNYLISGNDYHGVDFPDPTDAGLNANNNAKKDYLLIFLAAIKNTADQRRLTSTIRTIDPVREMYFPTNGNSSAWFAEMRYRLYHVFLKRNDLTNGDKRTLIGMFIHAGKHCSDAKKDQIRTSLALFNNSVNTDLEMRERDLAVTLEEKIQYVATREKNIILKGRVDGVYALVIGGGHDNLIGGGNDAAYVRREGITFKAATWDYYAPQLGLPLNGTQYPNMRLTINDSLVGAGAYSPTLLLNKVRTDLGELIKDTYAGSLQHVMQYHDKLILGPLSKKAF